MAKSSDSLFAARSDVSPPSSSSPSSSSSSSPSSSTASDGFTGFGAGPFVGSTFPAPGPPPSHAEIASGDLLQRRPFFASLPSFPKMFREREEPLPPPRDMKRTKSVEMHTEARTAATSSSPLDLSPSSSLSPSPSQLQSAFSPIGYAHPMQQFAVAPLHPLQSGVVDQDAVELGLVSPQPHTPLHQSPFSGEVVQSGSPSFLRRALSADQLVAQSATSPAAIPNTAKPMSPRAHQQHHHQVLPNIFQLLSGSPTSVVPILSSTTPDSPSHTSAAGSAAAAAAATGRAPWGRLEFVTDSLLLRKPQVIFGKFGYPSVDIGFGSPASQTAYPAGLPAQFAAIFLTEAPLSAYFVTLGPVAIPVLVDNNPVPPSTPVSLQNGSKITLDKQIFTLIFEESFIIEKMASTSLQSPRRSFSSSPVSTSSLLPASITSSPTSSASPSPFSSPALPPTLHPLWQPQFPPAPVSANPVVLPSISALLPSPTSLAGLPPSPYSNPPASVTPPPQSTATTSPSSAPASAFSALHHSQHRQHHHHRPRVRSAETLSSPLPTLKDMILEAFNDGQSDRLTVSEIFSNIIARHPAFGLHTSKLLVSIKLTLEKESIFFKLPGEKSSHPAGHQNVYWTTLHARHGPNTPDLAFADLPASTSPLPGFLLPQTLRPDAPERESLDATAETEEKEKEKEKEKKNGSSGKRTKGKGGKAHQPLQGTRSQEDIPTGENALKPLDAGADFLKFGVLPLV